MVNALKWFFESHEKSENFLNWNVNIIKYKNIQIIQHYKLIKFLEKIGHSVRPNSLSINEFRIGSSTK